jgi:ABC-type multidrug transport system fused ATPase/permease subunit
VSFENVAFSYPDGRKVLTDFSLRMDPASASAWLGNPVAASRP